MDAQILRLVTQNRPLSASQINELVHVAGQVPFVFNLLPVNALLWGSFWQFDVIAPGYLVPALELALLQATRLDGHWPPHTTPYQFLVDLQTTVTHPLAGVWTMMLEQHPVAVFAAPAKEKRNHPPENTPPLWVTVVWFSISTGHLHAGYRTAASSPHFKGMVEQRLPGFRLTASAKKPPPGWLAATVQQLDPDKNKDPVILLHEAILCRRVQYSGE